MDKDYLILKRASASRSSGEWNDDDYDVLADGAVVGRIFKGHAAPVGTPWMWTLAFARRRTATHRKFRPAFSRPSVVALIHHLLTARRHRSISCDYLADAFRCWKPRIAR
jgi:hypothetical protein